MERELVDAGQVSAALAVLSLAALVLAIVLGLLARQRRGLLRGALLAACAALAWPAWLVYNAIEDHFGLDSVAALLINLALFAAAGTLGGLVVRRFWPIDSDNLHRGDTDREEVNG